MGSQPQGNMRKYKKYERNNFICLMFFNWFNYLKGCSKPPLTRNIFHMETNKKKSSY